MVAIVARFADPVVQSAQVTANLGIKPNFEALPFMNWLKEMVGGVWAVGLILAFLALIVMGMILLFAKLSANSRMSESTVSKLLAVFLITLIISSAGGLFAWIQTQNIFA